MRKSNIDWLFFLLMPVVNVENHKRILRYYVMPKKLDMPAILNFPKVGAPSHCSDDAQSYLDKKRSQHNTDRGDPIA